MSWYVLSEINGCYLSITMLLLSDCISFCYLLRTCSPWSVSFRAMSSKWKQTMDFNSSSPVSPITYFWFPLTKRAATDQIVIYNRGWGFHSDQVDLIALHLTSGTWGGTERYLCETEFGEANTGQNVDAAAAHPFPRHSRTLPVPCPPPQALFPRHTHRLPFRPRTVDGEQRGGSEWAPSGGESGGAAGAGVQGGGGLVAWSIAVRPGRREEIHPGRRERGVDRVGNEAVSSSSIFDSTRTNRPQILNILDQSKFLWISKISNIKHQDQIHGQ